MTPPSPVITGVGLVSPLGRTADATWHALLAGRQISGHTRLTAARDGCLPRVTLLAIEAAAEACRQAGWTTGTPAAVVGCTSKGPVEGWLTPAAASTSDNTGRGVAVASLGYGLDTLTVAVAATLQLTDGPRLTLSAACAGGLQALVRGALLIASGEADRVLVVAAEASVHPLFIGSFDRLGVLPPPGQPCRPFDVDRQGFLMSEAAAAVCLERDPSPTTDLPPVVINRFALGADASHLTGIDRDGTTLRRLVSAVANSQGFDLVHAHGTATELNDAAELRAFATGLPTGGAGGTLYSHKAGLGHTLGASGLVSIVLNVLAHRDGRVPPNVNTRWPLATSLELTSSPVIRPVRRSLACAAGFGGGVAAVSLRGG